MKRSQGSDEDGTAGWILYLNWPWSEYTLYSTKLVVTKLVLYVYKLHRYEVTVVRDEYELRQ